MTRTEAETAARKFLFERFGLDEQHRERPTLVTMTDLAALADLLLQTRTAALEEAAKVLCVACEKGVPMEYDDDECILHQAPYDYRRCDAAPIRALAATTKGDGT